MAIAYDSSSNSGNGVVSWSHTCTGTNLVLLVACYSNGTSPTAVTYNSVSLTQIVTGTNMTIWMLLSPPTGAHTIAVTTTTTTKVHLAVSYTGCDTALNPNAFNTGYNNAGAGTTLAYVTYGLTATVTNCWIVDLSIGYSSFGAGGSVLVGDLVYSRISGVMTSTYVTNITDDGGTRNYLTPQTTSPEMDGAGSGTTYISSCMLALAPYTAPPFNGDFFAFF